MHGPSGGEQKIWNVGALAESSEGIPHPVLIPATAGFPATAEKIAGVPAGAGNQTLDTCGFRIPFDGNRYCRQRVTVHISMLVLRLDCRQFKATTMFQAFLAVHSQGEV